MSRPGGSRPARKEDQIYGQKLAEMAKKHSNIEAFYALDDPLEATVFSVLLELVKEMDKADHDRRTCGLIPPTECAI